MPCDAGTEDISQLSSTPPTDDDLGTKTDLIILVKKHRELYDKNDPLYKNNAHKGVLWNQIAKNLGGVHSAKKVREQFSYMRRRFEEEYYNRKHGILRHRIEPDAANYRKPLFVFDQLTFLEPFIQRDKTEENADVENKPCTSESTTEDNSWLDYLAKLTTGTSEIVDLNLNNISVSNAANTNTFSFATYSSASPSLPVASSSFTDNASAVPCKRRRKNPPTKKESRDVSVTSTTNLMTSTSPAPVGFDSAAFISGNLASSAPTLAPSTMPSNIDLSEMVKIISDSVKDDLVNQECSLFGIFGFANPVARSKMAPSSRCAHELTPRKKMERTTSLMSFIKMATPVQLSSKLVEVWATPQCSITDVQILLTLGANPELLYKNDYGNKTLADRVDAGSVCTSCEPKFQNFLEMAMKIYDVQFHRTPIRVNNRFTNGRTKKNNFTSDLIAMSLDGGGMRGLVSVVCLLFTSRRLFGDESLVDKIDWLVGCSTGAMLSLALAKGFTLTETFFLYWEMKNEIFLDKSTMARLFGSVVDKQTNRLNEVLKRCFPCEDDTFQNCARRLTVPALNIARTPAKLHTFRNYPIKVDGETTSENGEEHISFRDAARASSAAPTYFHPHTMAEDKIFVDGSLVANSPLNILFREFDKSIQAGKDISLGCVISIGTGEPNETKRRYKSGNTLHKKGKYLRDMAVLLMEQVVGHEKSVIGCIEDRCAAASIPFFRICPTGIDVRIDQVDDGKLMDMIWMTLLYLSENLQIIDNLGWTLKTVAERSYDASRLRSHTVQ